MAETTPSGPELVGALLFETGLYGMYIILYAVCLHVLLTQKRVSTTPLLVFASLMFAIATTDMAMTMTLIFKYIAKGVNPPWAFLYSKILFYVTNNILADMLLIYRCYMVWDRRKLVVVPLLAALIASSVCGYVFTASPSARLRGFGDSYLWMTFSINALVTCCIAGRIWWIANAARNMLGSDTRHKYHAAMAMIVESGLIYCVYILLNLTIRNVVLDAGLVQIVGLVPTLILVQVGLGREAKDLQTTVAHHTVGTPVFTSRFGSEASSDTRRPSGNYVSTTPQPQPPIYDNDIHEHAPSNTQPGSHIV